MKTNTTGPTKRKNKSGLVKTGLFSSLVGRKYPKTLIFILLIIIAAISIGAWYIYKTAGVKEMSLETFLIEGTGTTYYVDSIGGNDASSGLSESQAWRSVSRVHSASLIPGDTVKFKRGGSYGALTIDNSGVSGNPITFTAYGTGPLKPVFSAGWSDWAKAIVIWSDHVIVQDLLVKDTKYAGVFIEKGADHNMISDVEVTNVGFGFAVYGMYNEVTKNYAHDLIMVRSDPGGDNDYGAVGYQLYADNNTVSYNKCIRCAAPCYDYGNTDHSIENGRDGGAIEIFGNVSNSYIHHNYAEESEGFLEVGGDPRTGQRTVHNTKVSYNVLVNNERALHLNLGSYQYWADIQNLRFENNTVIQTRDRETVINMVSGSVSGSQLVVQNNIFYGFDRFARILTSGEPSSTQFTHKNNLYYGMSQSFPMGSGEIWNRDPLFVSLANKDYHLKYESPAKDAGIGLPDYTMDYDGYQVPSGSVSDLGAYEYQIGPAVSAAPTPAPTPTAVPVSTPTQVPTPTPVPVITPSASPRPTTTPIITPAPTLKPIGTPTPAINLRGTTTKSNGTDSSSLTMSKPNRAAHNDVLIAQVSVLKATAVITPPSGWTLIRRVNTGTDLAMAVYYKVVGRDEPSSYKWTFDSRLRASGGMANYSYVSTANPVDASSASYNRQTSTMTGQSVTTTTSTDRLLYFGAIRYQTAMTSPSSMSERWEVKGGDNGWGLTSLFADERLSTWGSTGVRIGSHGAGDVSNVVIMVALKPM